MKYTRTWKKDWHVCDGDDFLSEKMAPVFESYLSMMNDKGVSKTTFNRHKYACHSLGGYIVGQVYGYELDEFDKNESGKEIILRYIDSDGGPLINHDNENWQREIDAMCKKLYKFLSTKESQE